LGEAAPRVLVVDDQPVAALFAARVGGCGHGGRAGWRSAACP
jgi:predicted oxidoreductase